MSTLALPASVVKAPCPVTAVEIHGVTILVDSEGYAVRVPLHQVESGLDLGNGYSLAISAEHLDESRRRVRVYVLVVTATGAYVDESIDLDAMIDKATALAAQQATRCDECGHQHDEADPADWPSWTDEIATELLDPRDDAIEITPEDWEEFGRWSEAIDVAWLADLADREATLDEPDPSTSVDFDELYHDRCHAEYPATLDVGHPAQEG